MAFEDSGSPLVRCLYEEEAPSGCCPTVVNYALAGVIAYCERDCCDIIECCFSIMNIAGGSCPACIVKSYLAARSLREDDPSLALVVLGWATPRNSPPPRREVRLLERSIVLLGISGLA